MMIYSSPRKRIHATTERNVGIAKYNTTEAEVSIIILFFHVSHALRYYYKFAGVVADSSLTALRPKFCCREPTLLSLAIEPGWYCREPIKLENVLPLQGGQLLRSSEVSSAICCRVRFLRVLLRRLHKTRRRPAKVSRCVIRSPNMNN